MVRIRRIVVGVGVAAIFLAPTAALAQADPYEQESPAVLGQEFQNDPPEVRGAAEVRGETAVRSAGLAVTGGDVLGLTVIGLGAIGAGTVMVRRSRRTPTLA